MRQENRHTADNNPRVILALVFSLVLHAGMAAFAGSSIKEPEKPQFQAEVDLKLLQPPAPEPKAAPPPKTAGKTKPESEKKVTTETKPETEPEPKPVVKPKPKPKPTKNPRPKPEPEPEKKPEPKPDPEQTPEKKSKPEPEPVEKKKEDPGLPEARKPPESDSLFDRISNKMKSSRANLAPRPDPDAILARYQRAVRRKVERKKHYPPGSRRSGETGVVRVRFVIESSGGIRDIRVVKSSGHALLDRAAQQAVQQAAPFPPIPPELKKSSLTLILPVSFHLKHGYR